MAALDIEGIKKPVAALYPVVEELRCVELQIPNDDGYLWVLAGFVSILGQSWSWLGSKDDRIARARLWIKAYEATDWMQCMNCEQLIECITPLFDAQTAEIQRLINFSKYGDANQPGVPLSEEERERDRAAGTNPSCNLDVTWAQALQIVQYGNQLITDALQLAESATNDVELVQVITQLPGIDEVGADAIASYINLLLEGITENYAAQYTEEYEQQTACAIFCLAQLNCEISLDLIYSVFYDRVTARFGTPPETISTIVDLLAYLVDQDIDGTIIADVLMLVIFGGGVLANIFLGDVGTKRLETLLGLDGNDANNDWVLLCDCPGNWEYFVDLSELALWTDYALDDEGVYSSGLGWGGSADPDFATSNLFGRNFSAATHILSVEPIWSAVMTGDWNEIFVGGMPSVSPQVSEVQSGLSQDIPFNEVVSGLVVGGYENHDFEIPMTGKYINGLIVRGFGYQPPELGG